MSVESQSGSSSDLEIPRLTFEFDPTNTSNVGEFSFTIPNSDIKSAVARQDLNPTYIPRPEAGFLETLESAVTENEGGAISVTTENDLTVVRFGFKPLADLEDPGDGNYYEQNQRANVNRLPQFAGKKALFEKLAKITSLQYQLGVPTKYFDSSHPVAPARFSFKYGTNTDEPTFVITESFEEALKNAKEKLTQERLTADLLSYLAYSSSMTPVQIKDSLTGPTQIPAQHRSAIFDVGGSIALGIGTDKYFTEEAIRLSRNVPSERSDVILQPGDLYFAEGQNLDNISAPRTIAMVAVGSIARLCREIRQ